jgi:hypothetical protein
MALLAVGAYQLYGVFSNVGYQPEQPIKYSHVLHAGVMKMECLYCHFTAEKSKHAAVPPVDVCMGCHSVVRQDSPEIKKLTEYFEKGIPVPWERIHDLPDHSYFTHQRHIEAGVSCQTCHGPIEEMPVVGQVNKLEMGDCMTCHRNDNYIPTISHPPTWYNADEYTSLELEKVPEGIAGGISETPELTEQEWQSLQAEFAKYHQGAMDPDRQSRILSRMAEYKDNIYLHGWSAQLRNENASIQCNTCHQ